MVANCFLKTKIHQQFIPNFNVLHHIQDKTNCHPDPQKIKVAVFAVPQNRGKNIKI